MNKKVREKEAGRMCEKIRDLTRKRSEELRNHSNTRPPMKHNEAGNMEIPSLGDVEGIFRG